MVKRGAVPWSIVRATGFYWLLDRMLATMAGRPVMFIPGAVRMQPVDSDEFAGFVAGCASEDERGERPDFAGPQILTMRELAETYLAARSLSRRVWNAPMPGRVKRALEASNTSLDAHLGTTTWTEWLRRGSA